MLLQNRLPVLRQTMIVVIFGLCALKVCTAFLLEDNCPAPSPCTCSGSSSSYAYIYCQSKDLTAMPKFIPSNHHVNTLNLYMTNNNLKTVPAYAFKNLSSINASTFYIQLYNNQINQVNNDAFTGLDNTTNTYLYLQNNNLTAIPLAIAKISRLVYLDIRDNPIRYLNNSVMSSVGSSLETLLIDLGSFSEWPRELRHLSVLKTLNIQNIPFAHLEADIFHGLENSLTSLTIEHSKQLEKVPFAVCNLPKLQSITFNNCPHLKENRSSIFEHCQGRHATVTSLTLNYNNLDIFPDVLHLFPSLNTFYLYNNNLELIETEKIPYHILLTTINLGYNQFKRIPSAFHKLKSLTTIYMQNNEIISVEDFDLNVLKDLTYLDLDYNPIRYISLNAFKGNQKLQTLTLQYTKLTNIPASVLSLAVLRTFYIAGAPVECSCDMSYLKHWNVTAVTNFNGQCVSLTQPVKQYLTTSLQHCP